MITRAAIWESYRHLHAYARWPVADPYRRIVGPTLPSDTPPASRMPSLYRNSCQRLAEGARTALATHPIQVPPAQFAYVFLFAQWRRISWVHTPTYLGPTEGWVNMRWLPITAFAAKDPEAMQRVWRFVQYEGLKEGDGTPGIWDALYHKLPLQAESLVQEIGRQADRLTKIQSYWHCAPQTALLQFDAVGERRSETRHPFPWHPYLILAVPEAWEPIDLNGSLVQQTPAAREAWRELIGNRTKLRTWLADIVPIVNPNPSQLTYHHLREHFSGLVETEQQARAWARAEPLFGG